MGKMVTQALLLAAALTAGADMQSTPKYRMKSHKTPPMPLTDEEKAKLESMEPGREKKAYVKELEAKYRGKQV